MTRGILNAFALHMGYTGLKATYTGEKHRLIAGLIVLLLIDGVIASMALALARSDRALSHPGIPLWWVLIFCLAAFGTHLAGQSIFEALVLHANDNIPVERLFIYGVPSGLVAAVCCAYLILVCASGAVTGALEDHKPSLMPEMFTEAQRRFRKGDINGAVEEYRRLAKKYPASPEPLIAAAGVLDSTGRPGEAVALLREVMDSFKWDDESWFRAAHRLVPLLEEALNRPEETAALKRLIQEREARRTQPKPTRLGHHADSTSVEHQVDRYRKRFREHPGSPRPLFAAALALERDGQYEAAANMLREAIRHFQHDDEIWGNTAYRLALLLKNHFQDAQAARMLWQQIVRRAPSTAAGHLAAARLAELQRKE